MDPTRGSGQAWRASLFPGGAEGRDVGAFFRLLRRALGRDAFPYLWVGEWHPKGHGLHVHFGVGRFIPRVAIKECWPHGFISIKLIGDVPVPVTRFAEARVTARYL